MLESSRRDPRPSGALHRALRGRALGGVPPRRRLVPRARNGRALGGALDRPRLQRDAGLERRRLAARQHSRPASDGQILALTLLDPLYFLGLAGGDRPGPSAGGRWRSRCSSSRPTSPAASSGPAAPSCAGTGSSTPSPRSPASRRGGPGWAAWRSATRRCCGSSRGCSRPVRLLALALAIGRGLRRATVRAGASALAAALRAEPARQHLRFLAGAALAAALLLPLGRRSAAAPRPTAASSPTRCKHKGDAAHQQHGAAHGGHLPPRGGRPRLVSAAAADPWLRWKRARLAAWERSRPLAACGPRRCARACSASPRAATRSPGSPPRSAPPSIAFAVELTSYYYAFLIVPALLWSRWRFDRTAAARARGLLAVRLARAASRACRPGATSSTPGSRSPLCWRCWCSWSRFAFASAAPRVAPATRTRDLRPCGPGAGPWDVPWRGRWKSALLKGVAGGSIGGSLGRREPRPDRNVQYAWRSKP